MFVVVPLGLVLLGFWRVTGQSANTNAFKNVAVEDLANAQEANHIILDVRQPEEFGVGHVSGAVLIPLGALEARAGELPKDATLYVICRSGNRSRQASEILVQAGFQNVRNVEGGILAWQAAGYKVKQ